ncbi:MAG: hypothetical protein R3233_04795, partial [Xanthomonadales bacterium]|nr:hypothetical protein [Xanthomonadales bacterium]
MTASAEDRQRLYVSVTAHRDLVAAELPGIEARVEACFRELADAFPDLPATLLTPLAEGGDRLAARVALRLGVPVVAVLPMAQPEYERDFDTPASLQEFHDLLDQAEHQFSLPAAPGNGAAPFEGRARDIQYAQLGVFLSNHCQVLLALWDGKAGARLGGTGQVVEFHLTALMPGFEADSTPAGLLAENENDLVYHVVCSRDRPDGQPAEGLQPATGAWFSSRADRARSAALPGEYREMLARLECFVRDWQDHADAIGHYSPGLLQHAPDLALPSGAGLTDRLFRAADCLAIHYQKRVHGSLRAIHVLAVLMGLVFLVYTEFDAPNYLVLGFLALFFAGVAVHYTGESREWHRKYLDYRALAEGLRVQLYWNLAGVVDPVSVEFAYDNFLQKQDTELGWIRHVMRRASLRRMRGQAPPPEWVGWVVDEWVGGIGAARGQLGYYARKESENSARYQRTSRLGTLCLWSGIGIAVLLFLTGQYGQTGIRQGLLVGMGVLPLIAGVWDAYSHKRAEKELIKQYAFMGRVFRKARALLDGSSDVEFHRRVLRALGQAALDEGAEWLLM